MQLLLLLLLACDDGSPAKAPAEPAPAAPEADPGDVDADGDGYPSSVDCDDTSRRIHPDAAEWCNHTDEACDGVGDDADADYDGQQVCEGDCDDTNRDINTHEDEVWYDGIDQDCDGRDDDRDGDGHPLAEDCDDLDATSFVGAEERCDGVDNDCDGVVPADEQNEDGDAERICDGDCDDTSLWALSTGVEICDDGLDNDCDGVVDLACAHCDVLVPGDFPTLQAAIDGAAAGDVVCAAGDRTYAENLDFGGAAVTLWGIHGAARTTLDGGGSAVGLPVVQFTSAEGPESVLRGFTVTNGETVDYGGAGIRVVDASPTLVDLIVTRNGDELCCTNDGGGGIWIEGGAPTLVDSAVIGNLASYGGGIHIERAEVVLENVAIQANKGDRAGCGVYVEGGSVRLFQVSLLDSDFYCYEGGGLYAKDADIALTNVLVAENGAGSYGYGGGIALSGASARLDNVIVHGNGAGAEVGYGGGLYAYTSSVELTNVVISGNGASARDYPTEGGGIYAWNTELVLTNVVVSNNVTWWGRYSTVSGAGDGIYLRGSSTALLRYTNLWGDHPDNLVVVDSPATVNTDAPLSVDPAFEDDALHLSVTSPLIDAGDPAILDPDGSRSDIGAYGGAFAARWDLDGDGWSAWWLPGAYDPATSPDMDCDDGNAAVYPGSGC